MYEQKKIITEPYSNNRLDYDTRRNKSIVVPSLIMGTLDDVKISNNIAIECEVDGKIVAGKGLKNLVFLDNARVPTWIMDNHNHAFAFWYEALSRGYIQSWSLLVHIDQHTDLGTPLFFPKVKDTSKSKRVDDISLFPGTIGIHFQTYEEVEEYTNSILTIADFIVPALADWLISEAHMITGEDRQASQSYVWQMNNDGMLIKKSSLLPFSLDLYPSVIVDLDLDYFAQWFDEKICLENVIYWLQKADIVTIATSPLFIEQEQALKILKNLQKYLLAL